MSDDRKTGAVVSGDRPAVERAQPIQQTGQQGGPGSIGAVAADANAADNDQSTVSVKPIKSFRWGDQMKHPAGEGGHPEGHPSSQPFEVKRHEAQQLHATGLVDYASEGDETAAHEEAAKTAAEGVKTRRAAQKAASGLKDTDKSTPLKQGAVVMARTE